MIDMEPPTGKPPLYQYVTTNPTVQRGVTFGSTLAIVVSYGMNESIFWAIVHGLFSWFYIIYFILIHS